MDSQVEINTQVESMNNEIKLDRLNAEIERLRDLCKKAGVPSLLIEGPLIPQELSESDRRWAKQVAKEYLNSCDTERVKL